MKFNKTMIIVSCASMLPSFIYGMISAHYHVFPFNQLRAVKELVLPAPIPPPIYSDHFYNEISFFEQHGSNNYDVVFIGDSITERAEWKDLFPSLKIANRGISGDRTDGIIKRLGSIYSSSANRAFIMVGTNDFNARAKIDDVFDNYKAIVEGLSDHGMEVFIQSTILAGEQREYLNPKILALNKKLKQLATSN